MNKVLDGGRGRTFFNSLRQIQGYMWKCPLPQPDGMRQREQEEDRMRDKERERSIRGRQTQMKKITALVIILKYRVVSFNLAVSEVYRIHVYSEITDILKEIQPTASSCDMLMPTHAANGHVIYL